MTHDELTRAETGLSKAKGVNGNSDESGVTAGSSYFFSSIEALYRNAAGTGELQNHALMILALRSWFDTLLSFDPQSGQPLTESLDTFLKKITEVSTAQDEIHDRLYRIALHTEPALSALVQTMRTAIIREHRLQPIYEAREIDSAGMQWLSRRPGRTVREKLSGKPFIKAVKRKTTADTAENRLLKAFILRFTDLIMQRELLPNHGKEPIAELLLPVLERYRTQEVFDEIGLWNNTPPNNTLLQDKQYKKIWDGWQHLQALDRAVEADSRRIYTDILTAVYWKTIALINRCGQLRLVQQPIGFDYDIFGIIPEEPLKGVLIQNNPDRLCGSITHLTEKGYGFITAENNQRYFFHYTSLPSNIPFTDLKIGMYFTFDSIATEKGMQAVHLSKRAADALPISFTVSANRMEIHVCGTIVSAQIFDNYLWITEPAHAIKKRFPLHPYILDEVPKQLTQLIADISFYGIPAPQEYPYDVPAEKTEICAIDLCAVRPFFTDVHGVVQILPFRLLLQQKTLHNAESFILDCGTAKAVKLHSACRMVSMKSLFFESDEISEQYKKTAALFFSEKLQKHIPADTLVYLIPDWTNEFNLDSIRKSINFYFRQSIPLPQSIAAVFSWQLSNSFQYCRICEHDIVLIADIFDEGIVITPLRVRYEKHITAIVPETRGIYWERHPPLVIKNDTHITGFIKNLKTCGCGNAETVFHLFGAAGLVQEADRLSFVYNDTWFHVPSSIHTKLHQQIPVTPITDTIIEKCMSALPFDRHRNSVFFLPLNPHIKTNDSTVSVCTLEHEPIAGARMLYTLQKKLDEAGIAQTLWCDYLPTLAMKVVRNGQYEHFYLVKDASIKPQRDKTVAIEGQEQFMLPAHQPHYCFPLLQGTGNTALKFAAFLRSPAFPLKEDTLCRLSMTYTYGADEPYELHFIPEHQTAPFKSIRVEWQPLGYSVNTESEQLPTPAFPTSYTWSDFQRYPKDDGTFSNLLEWCCNKLASLERVYRFDFNTEVRKHLQQARKAGIFEWGAYDKNGDYYCRIQVEGNSVFCHSRYFLENIDPSALNAGSIVYAEIKENQKGYYGTHISLSADSQAVWDSYTRIVQQDFQKLIERTESDIRTIRFPVFTIWNNGHSLSEPEVPDMFRMSIHAASSHAVTLMQNDTVPDSLKEELFLFLCCLHKDAPFLVHNMLLENIDDAQYLWRHRKNIGFTVGNADLPYQKMIVHHIIAPCDNIHGRYSTCMHILSIICWRSEKIIFTFSAQEIQYIHTILYDCLTFGIKKIVEQPKSFVADNLCKHLELLLALLRTRNSSDPIIRSILALNSPQTQLYIDLIDTIVQMLNKHRLELRFRIRLCIEKPEQFHNTPDLLYAIRMFLSADSGASAIAIASIDENNEE